METKSYLLLIAEALREGRLNGGVVGTLMSNMSLELALKQLAIPFVRAECGRPLCIGTNAGAWLGLRR